MPIWYQIILICFWYRNCIISATVYTLICGKSQGEKMKDRDDTNG